MGDLADKLLDGLPTLRPELEIYPAGNLKSGSPSWNIYDPVSHEYYQIGWSELEVISAWQAGSTLENFIEYVLRATGGIISPDKIEDITSFVIDNGLTDLPAERQQKMPLLNRLFKPFMYQRIVLWRPEKPMERAAKLTSSIKGSHIGMFILFGAIFSLWIVLTNLNAYLHTFDYLFQPYGLFLMGAAMLMVKLVHEFGHAIVAARVGCRVTNMGVAFLFLWPVFYTDVSDSWRINNKNKRIAIDLAGVSSELALAVIATVVWWTVDEGPVKTIAFLLSSTTWIFSLLINLNPLMKFDGYYALSDALEIPNLSSRAGRYITYRFRQGVMSVALPKRDVPPVHLRRLFMTYGIGSIFYRYFVFTLLAFGFSYSLPKILAYPLIAGFAWFMIFSPIIRQGRYFYEGWEFVNKGAIMKRVLWVLIPLLILLFMPVRQNIDGPGLIRKVPHTIIYAPQAATVDAIYAQEGDMVKKGQKLVQLSSFDLDSKLSVAQARLSEVKSQLDNVGLSGQSTSLRQVLEKGRVQLQAEIQAITEQQARLSLYAPFDAQVTSLSPVFKNPSALGANEVLMHLVGREGYILSAYVGEEIQKLAVGGAIDQVGLTFYEGTTKVTTLKVPATLTPVKFLEDAELASLYGGDIAVRETSDELLVPEKTLYRLTAQMDDIDGFDPNRLTIGTVRITLPRETLASSLYKALKIWFLQL